MMMAHRLGDFWRPGESERRRRRDQRELQRGETQHRIAPADMRLGDRENRRPDCGGHRRTAAEQGQGRAAAPVEPVRNINVERRVDAGIAKQADKQAVPKKQAQPATTLRHDQSNRDHRRAEDDRGTDAETLGRAPHRDAAKGGAEPRERISECRHRAFPSKFLGDRAEPNDRDRRSRERNRRDGERGHADDPGPAALDDRNGCGGSNRRGNARVGRHN
jgi:hypothetical protein